VQSADFLLEGATAIVIAPGIQIRDAVLAAFAGRIVFVGPAARAQAEVTRRPGAMRIDATGCSIFPALGPLEVGASLDAIIAKGAPDATGRPAADAIRMEIAAGKIVRWEQGV
jgi:hypothetical protein